MLAVNLNVGNIVLKHGGYIDLEEDCVSNMFGFQGSCPQAIVLAPVSTEGDDTHLWERSFRKNNQQTSLYGMRNLQMLFLVDDDNTHLATSTITNDNEFPSDFRHSLWERTQ